MGYLEKAKAWCVRRLNSWLGVNLTVGMNLFRESKAFPVVKSRLPVIRRYVSGSRVLDLGCVDHDASTEATASWLHRYVSDHAETVLGVDIAREEVEKLRAKGYNVVHGDVETLDLGLRFDVIVAGELIEHVSNQGLFFDTCRRHLNPGGVLILSTPNALSLVGFAAVLLLGNRPVNTDHVLFHNFATLRQSLARCGFEVAEGYYVLDREHGLRFMVDRIATLVRRDFASGLLCVARVRADDRSGDRPGGEGISLTASNPPGRAGGDTAEGGG